MSRRDCPGPDRYLCYEMASLYNMKNPCACMSRNLTLHLANFDHFRGHVLNPSPAVSVVGTLDIDSILEKTGRILYLAVHKF